MTRRANLLASLALAAAAAVGPPASPAAPIVGGQAPGYYRMFVGR